MIVTTQSGLDTSGLIVAQPGVVPDSVTQAALDSLPASGLQPFNLIDYANTTATPTFSPNLWLIAAAVGVFVLALSMGGTRR